MILGTTILTNDTAGTVYYSPWFPRSGNKLTSTIEMMALGASGDINTFQAQVETKNYEQSDNDAVSVGSAKTVTLTAGTYNTWTVGEGFDGTAEPIKEQVRYVYTLKAAASPTNLPAWVHFRNQAPSWSTN